MDGWMHKMNEMKSFFSLMWVLLLQLTWHTAEAVQYTLDGERTQMKKESEI